MMAKSKSYSTKMCSCYEIISSNRVFSRPQNPLRVLSCGWKSNNFIRTLKPVATKSTSSPATSARVSTNLTSLDLSRNRIGGVTANRNSEVTEQKWNIVNTKDNDNNTTISVTIFHPTPCPERTNEQTNKWMTPTAYSTHSNTMLVSPYNIAIPLCRWLV